MTLQPLSLATEYGIIKFILTNSVVCILQDFQQSTNSLSTVLKHTQLYKRKTHRMQLSAFGQPNVYWKDWNGYWIKQQQSAFSQHSVTFQLTELQSFTMWLEYTSHEVTTINKTVSVHLYIIKVKKKFNNLDNHTEGIYFQENWRQLQRLLCLFVTVLLLYYFDIYLPVIYRLLSRNCCILLNYYVCIFWPLSCIYFW